MDIISETMRTGEHTIFANNRQIKRNLNREPQKFGHKKRHIQKSYFCLRWIGINAINEMIHLKSFAISPPSPSTISALRNDYILFYFLSNLHIFFVIFHRRNATTLSLRWIQYSLSYYPGHFKAYRIHTHNNIYIENRAIEFMSTGSTPNTI